jgi:hypothetical protein
MKSKIFLLYIGALLFSCTKSELPNSSPPSIDDFPALIRKLALIEGDYTSNSLSTSYNTLYGVDGSPKYFEFQVLESEMPVGTLCAYADRSQDHVIAYILNELRVRAKSSPEFEVVISYPTDIVTGVLTKSGFITFDGELITSPLVKLYDNVEPELIQEITEQLRLESLRATRYWSLVDSVKDEILSLQIPKTKGTSYREYSIPQYDTERMQNTFWQGGCGPSALAYIYRGLYDEYKGKYLPLYGDLLADTEGRVSLYGRLVYDYKDVDGDHDGDGDFNMVDREWVKMKSDPMDSGLYYDLCDYEWYYWFGNAFGSVIPSLRWGATLPWNLVGVFENVTNNEYSVTYLPVGAISHIREKKLPVVVLTSNFSHYLCAYGVREKIWDWSLFGIKFQTTTQSWLKVIDNGTEIGKHNYLPYWMDNTVLNTIFKFGVTKK